MSIETPVLAGEDANDHQASVGDNAAMCVPGESGPLSCSIRLQSLSSSAKSNGLTENSDMREEW